VNNKPFISMCALRRRLGVFPVEKEAVGLIGRDIGAVAARATSTDRRRRFRENDWWPQREALFMSAKRAIVRRRAVSPGARPIEIIFLVGLTLSRALWAQGSLSSRDSIYA
jgi:hypothetical protein